MRLRPFIALAAAAAVIAVAVAPAAADPSSSRPPSHPAGSGSPAVESTTPAQLPAAPEAAWTVLVYMDGDNDLEKWVSHDLNEELAAVGSGPDVQAVVLADRGPGYSTSDGDWQGTLAFHVTKGMTATRQNAVADWGERDMGSPQTLIDFVNWARASYPARHTALFLWDHGWGWWPNNTLWDQTSNDTMDMDELRRALEAVHGVDTVGMDTCLGQMIEVEATLRGFADAVAASEDSLGYTGVDYARVLAKLQANPAMSGTELAIEIAATYPEGHDRWTRTSSAVALDGRWDELVAQVDALGWELLAGLGRHRKQFSAARKHMATARAGDAASVDLYDVARQLSRRTTSPAIRATSRKIMRAVKQVVRYQWSAPDEVRQHGLAIYWPATRRPPHRGADPVAWHDFGYYSAQLQFSRLTSWDDFLAAWGE